MLKLTKKGFTLVEIMIVVAIIGLLAAIAIPNFVKARETAQQNACINNLRQISAAKQQWALENNATAAWALENLDGGGKQFARRKQLYSRVIGADLADSQKMLADVIFKLGNREGHKSQGRGK